MKKIGFLVSIIFAYFIARVNRVVEFGKKSKITSHMLAYRS